jgi:hypothetical protein
VFRSTEPAPVHVTAAAASAGRSPAAWVRELALGSPAAVSPAPVELAAAPERLARTVATRLTPAQHALLEERAAAAGLPVASYVRAAVFGVTPPPRRRATCGRRSPRSTGWGTIALVVAGELGARQTILTPTLIEIARTGQLQLVVHRRM